MNDTGDITDDGITTDPTLTGQLEGDNIAYATVEFDVDGNGVADGQTQSAYDGSFTYYVPSLAAGVATVQARAVVNDVQQGSEVAGDWTSFSFTKEDPVHDNLDVVDLALVNDNGTSDSDLVTSDPRITGTLSGDGTSDYIIVEFDLDGDGVADDDVRSDAAGSFVYYAAGLALGPVTISARTREYDLATRTVSYGTWTSFSFTLVTDANQAPEIDTLELRADTGSDPADSITANPTLFGRVTNDTDFAWTTVEVDLDGDQVADEWAFPDDQGEFLFTPDALSLGAHTISARAVEWDPRAHAELAGDWQSITFTLEDEPDLAPTLTALALADDTGDVTDDGITSDPTLTGRILNEGSLGGVTIEVDTDNDGTADVVTQTDAGGKFQVRPAELPEGSATYQVRTQETDPVTGAVNTGNWTAFSFTYEKATNAPAEVSQLSLLEDTGSVTDDNITTNAALTGQVTNDGDVSGITVQFDHDGDGIYEGTAVTDDTGSFTYAPQGLAAGDYTIAARAVETTDDNKTLYGSWVSITFTLEELPRTDLHISDMHLVNDTGLSATDRTTADPEVTGQIAGDGVLDGITIEFDHNSDGIVDGSTVTANGGQFSYTPSSLKTGIVPLRARTSTEANGQTIVSPWYLFGFVYSPDPDGTDAQQDRTQLSDYEDQTVDAKSIYDQALDTADQVFQTAWQTAETDYQTILETATNTLNDTLSGAQQLWETQFATAQSDYLNALSAAESQYQTDLANFSGDPTSFALPDFTMPDLPDQAADPWTGQDEFNVEPPRYDGQEYNFDDDIVYQDEVADLENTYNQAVNTAETAYKNAIQNADDAHDQEVAAANQEYQEAERAARDARDAPLPPHPTIDLAVESINHEQRTAAAQAEYDATVAAAQAVYDQADLTITQTWTVETDQDSQAYFDAVQAANNAYDAAVSAASAAYDAAMADAPDPEEDQASYDAYANQAEADFEAASDAAMATWQADYIQANMDLEYAIAAAQLTHDTDTSEAERTFNDAVSTATRICDVAISESQRILDNAEAEVEYWQNEQRTLRQHDYAVAIANAAEIRDNRIAAADEVRDDAYADAEQTQTLALEAAEEARATGIVSDQENALVTWDGFEQDFWSGYQAALAHDRTSYIQGVATETGTLVTSEANATHTEEEDFASALLTEAEEDNAAAKSRASRKPMPSGIMISKSMPPTGTGNFKMRRAAGTAAIRKRRTSRLTNFITTGLTRRGSSIQQWRTTTTTLPMRKPTGPTFCRMMTKLITPL